MAAGDLFRTMAVFSNADTGEELTTHITLEESAFASAPDIADVGVAWKNWWNTGVTGANPEKSRHGASIALERVTLRRIYPLEPLEFEYNTGLPIVGTATGLNFPPQSAILVSLRTGLIGRSYRGRAYLPPPALNQSEGAGTITEASAEECGIAFTALLAALQADSGVPVVASFIADGVERTTPVGTPITLVRVDERLRSQRRRAAEAPLYV